MRAVLSKDSMMDMQLAIREEKTSAKRWPLTLVFLFQYMCFAPQVGFYVGFAQMWLDMMEEGSRQHRFVHTNTCVKLTRFCIIQSASDLRQQA